ncbi:hypothetical protein AB0F15_29210 [Amycolatopsis sp. NPDC026612]|uniref:hypothetical protein n=1 Tax=Amycolatopsis sp. NPDC026612 TaxID=3155466 RepID=UPI0033CA20DC
MIPRRRWAYVIPVAAVVDMPASLDRTNIAPILPCIGDDFPLSAGAKGPASGIFFVGYLVLQIPAALLSAKWSVRKTVLLLIPLASWFPQAEQARANALWMTCLPISAILMSPLSGIMLDHMSWRWVFGRPTDVAGSATTGFVVLAAFLAVAAGPAFFALKPVPVEGLAHAPAATRNA